MKDMRLLFVAAVLVAAFVVTGCGGGGGGGGAAITGGTGILTTIGADAGGGALSRSRDGVITAKLDAGAVIQAFDFKDGTLLATGIIGADGKGQIKLPAGKTVVVTVTGTRGGKSYRLSLIIPCTTEGQVQYTADPATTIAAEAIGDKLGYAKGTNEGIDNKTWNDIVAAAQAYIDGLPQAPDMSIGGGIIAAGKTFGAEGSIDAVKLADVISKVPETIDNALVKAKNAIFQIKQAGVPFQSLLTDEFADVATVAEGTGKAIDNAHLEQYGEKYSQMAVRLDDLIIPALMGGFTMPLDLSGVMGGLTVMDLEVGKAYQVTGEEDGLLLLEETAGGEAGKVKISRTIGNTVYLLRATPSASGWSLVQTSSADALMLYSVSAASTASGSTVAISLRDSQVTTPLAFNGTLAVAGPAGGPYTSMTITGSLSSAELTASGTTVLKFPAQPLGREGVADFYPNEIDISLTSGRYSVPGFTAQASGSLVMMMTTVESPIMMPLPLPTEIKLTNASLVVNAGGHVSTVSGNGTVKMSYVETDDIPDVLPTEFTISNFSASLEGGLVTVTGSLSVKAALPERSGDLGLVLPTEATLEGTYTNKHNGTSLTGRLTGKWDNPALDATPDTLAGTVTAVGTLKRANYEDFTVDLAIEADGEGTATLTVNKLGWTNSHLTGTGSFTFDQDGNLTEAGLTLTNQDGVQIVLDQDYNGTITVADEEVGEISKDGDAVRVDFSDETFEYLIGTPPVH